ncbi:hypothetical protein M569_10505, partial [Genlisea aurea]
FFLQAMLRFIYSDKLPTFHEIIGSTSTPSAIMMQHLLAAADRFGLERLKQLCEAKLCEEITVDTVETTLSLAEQHHCPQLKAACLKFAAANLGALMHSEGLEYLKQSCPSLLSEILETVAAGDGGNSCGGGLSGKKRSSSSIFGLDLSADGAAEVANINGSRRLRRR